MARTWTALYGSICTSKKLRSCANDASRVFYLLLLTQADPWGRIEDDAETLCARVWPLLGRSEKDTEKVLADLHNVGLITRHDVEGLRFIQVEAWADHAGKHQGGSKGSPKFPEVPRISPKVPGLSGEVRGLSISISSESHSDSGGRSAEEGTEPHPEHMTRKPVKAPRAPSGPVQELIALWNQLFREEVFDDTGAPVEYGPLHAADGPAVARLVKQRSGEVKDPALVRRRILALLRSPDPFWMTNRNLRTLASRWTDIASIPLADHNKKAARPQNAHDETLKTILATQPSKEPAHGVSGNTRLDQPRHRETQRSLPALQGPAGNGAAPAREVREAQPNLGGPRRLDVVGLLRGSIPLDGRDQPRPESGEPAL